MASSSLVMVGSGRGERFVLHRRDRASCRLVYQRVGCAATTGAADAWTRLSALRPWYQSSTWGGRPGIDFLRSGRGRSFAIKSFMLREERLNAKLYAISLGGDYPSDLQKDYLTSGPYRKLLMSAKKSGRHTNVLALIVAE